MKKTILTIATYVFLSSISYSQTPECNCSKNLTTLIAKTEENYAGFPAKVNNGTNLSYKKLIRTIQKQAPGIQKPKDCFYLLKDYVRFFKDKHFILSYADDQDYDLEMVVYSEDYFKRKISKKGLNKIEGIWISADASLKLAIQKSANDAFKGIVLESKDSKLPTGLVYVTLTPTKNGFIAKKYNSFITTDIPAKQKGNLLQIWNHEMFGKIYPTELTEQEQGELDTWQNNNNGLAFKKISEKTAYLKVPSFFNNESSIQQLVSKNDSLIRTSENLIVDLTGNGGGSTGWVSFLPYFMTNAVVQGNSYLRVTPDNVKRKLPDLEPFVLNPIPEDYKKYFPEEMVGEYKTAYQELPTTEKTYYPLPAITFPLDSIMSNPKKIALVIDDLCGSSAEYFFFISKQSKKTTTYGINTIGMMDYEGMSIPTAMPYDKFILTIPIVKSSWTDTNPIDQNGFKPDIRLDNMEQENWIDYIQKDLEQK